MSNAAKAKPTRANVIRASHRFLGPTAFWAIIFCVVHIFPFSNIHAPRSSIRLIGTLAFFTSALMLCWQMMEPRERYIQTLFLWRFEDAPESLERFWKRYLFSLQRACRVGAMIMMAFFVTTALKVLDQWYPGFNFIAGINHLLWMAAMAAIVLLPFTGGFLFTESMQRRRQLVEQLEITSWFKPRKSTDIWNPKIDRAKKEAVRVLGDRKFQAGGVKWYWNALTKNCIVFGMTGSGKTICVLNAMVDAIMASTRSSDELPSILVIDPKGDYGEKVGRLCNNYGREKDLLILDPANPQSTIRWNPLDSLDDDYELASRFTAVMEALGTKSGETSFWLDSARKFLRHSIYLLRKTNPLGTPPSFHEISRLLNSDSEIVRRTDRLNVTDSSTGPCLDYFVEWIEMPDEQRGGVQSHLSNMIDPFLMEPYKTVFAGRSTARISEMITAGKILYVNMPIADKEVMARTIGTFVKLEYFREVLKRPGKERPSLYVCDEFQVFYTDSQGKGDADFFERCRQSNHVNLVATQNLPSLLKQAKKKSSIDNFLGNCATKIFLRNADIETNQYASKLIGQSIVATGSSAASGSRGGLGKIGMGGAAVADSQTDQFVDRVRPERFTELIVPSEDESVDYAEAIIHQGARSTVSHEKTSWRVHPI